MGLILTTDLNGRAWGEWRAIFTRFFEIVAIVGQAVFQGRGCFQRKTTLRSLVAGYFFIN